MGRVLDLISHAVENHERVIIGEVTPSDFQFKRSDLEMNRPGMDQLGDYAVFQMTVMGPGMITADINYHI